MSKYSTRGWSKEVPDKENDGQWFVVRKTFGSDVTVGFAEVRWSEPGNEIYLCMPCNVGIQSRAFGTQLKLYPKDSLEFFGPIPMPTDYRK
jgi:hypothetical protein